MIAARALLSGAVARLGAAGVADPARDARLLLARALGTPAARLTLVLDDPVPPEAAERFAALLAERERRRPVSQILGTRAFWGRDFAVTGDVLDPRPETETLVSHALEGGPAGRVLDLGTGSGILLVTLLAEWPEATGVGTDVSAAALRVARDNADRLGVGGRADFVRTNWAEGTSGRFDVIVANPPYIPEADVAMLAPEVRDWEPRGALTAGATGLEAYAAIAWDLARLIAPGGRAILEFGLGQGPSVAAIFEGAGFPRTGFLRDMDGRDRAITINMSR